MTRTERLAVRDEFKNFQPPENFAGGCKKSDTIPGMCARLDWQGRIGKLDEGCPHLDQCKGYNYKFNP